MASFDQQVNRVPRIIRFVVIGGFCTMTQWLILVLLVEELDAQKIIANGIGFVLSTQFNFILSHHITYRDRRYGGEIGKRVIKYNVLALILLFFNSVAFGFALQFAPYNIAAVLGFIGTALGMAIRYFVGVKHIFVHTKVQQEVPLVSRKA